ncbi:MAG: hypothetical protein AAGD01_15805 [Acidobacteriota bacterium]
MLPAVVAGSLLLAMLPLAAYASDGGSPASDPITSFLQHTQEQGLPVSFLHPLGKRLEVVWHDVESVSPAFFLPSGTEVALLESWLLSEGRGGQAGDAPPPRLLLYGPIFRADAAISPGSPALVAPEELAVDAVEYLFHALIEAYFYLEVPGDTERSAALKRRADELLAEQPAERRQEAYLQASASFLSHLLAVANQLQRSSALHRQRGSDLCRHFDRRWSLFRLWDAIFQQERYRARWYRGLSEGASSPIPLQPSGNSGWVDTGVDLPTEDKLLLVELFLENAYRGTKEEDLAPRYCQPAEAAEPAAPGTP